MRVLPRDVNPVDVSTDPARSDSPPRESVVLCIASSRPPYAAGPWTCALPHPRCPCCGGDTGPYPGARLVVSALGSSAQLLIAIGETCAGETDDAGLERRIIGMLLTGAEPIMMAKAGTA